MDYNPPTYQIPKPSRAGWFVAFFALLAGAGAGFVAYQANGKNVDATSKIDYLQARLKDLEAKEKDLSAKLATAEAERNALQAAKDELSKDVQAKDEELSKLKGTYEQLQQRFKSELSSGEIQLMQEGSKLRVGLVDKILFGSGDATISKRGEGILMKVGAILAAIEDRQIQVSGHTDNTPISASHAKEFPTNWELSVTRATNVVRFLQEKAKVPPERLAASGFGEYHPVASNKSAPGRARNRRIEILLTPSLAPKTIAKSKLKGKAEKAEKPEKK